MKIPLHCQSIFEHGQYEDVTLELDLLTSAEENDLRAGPLDPGIYVKLNMIKRGTFKLGARYYLEIPDGPAIESRALKMALESNRQHAERM